MQKLLTVLAVAALALAGCTRTATCKQGTILLDLALAASLDDVDSFLIAVTVDGGVTRMGDPVLRNGRKNGTVEVTFTEYPVGKPVTIVVRAFAGSVERATATDPFTAKPGCEKRMIQLGDPTSPDLGGAGDMPPGPVPDLLGVDGALPPCENGVLDPNETDTDCGGACSKCGSGKTCTVNEDCNSNMCNSTTQKCVGGPCENGARDNAETDIDCGGGTCPACATGKACATATDCANGLCNLTQQLCVASACEDGALSAGESDVDCGSGCPTKCRSGESCNVNADCAAPGACDGTKHCIAAQCTNTTQDAANPSATPPIAAETDVDCGGTVCKPCPVGKQCNVGSDCQNGFCNVTTKVCVANQCLDGAKNGSESDIDCGGTCTTKCATGKGCSGPSDCAASGAVCASGLCCVPNCSGKICGSNGCGGSCGTCSSATTPQCNSGGTQCLCNSTSCATLGAGYVCNGSGQCACSTGSTENCFDGIDNNCDGLVDCADPQCGSGVAQCVTQAPSGWAYGRSVPAASCNNGNPNSLYKSVSSPSSCTGCSCSPVGRCTSLLYSDQNGAGSCSTPTTSTTYIGQTYAEYPGTPNGVCLSNAALKNQLTAVTTWSGSCNSTGAATKPSLNFTFQDYCTVSTIGGGCGSGKVCVPAGNTCIKGVGSCSGYSNVTTLYTGVDDSGRTCSACSGCSITAQGDCSSPSNSAITRNLGTSCDQGGNSQNSNSNSCFGGNPFRSATQYATPGVQPTCGGSPSATVSGSATLTGATSICCN